MRNQALFSPKDKSKKIKFCLLQFLCGTVRVKNIYILCASLTGWTSFEIFLPPAVNNLHNLIFLALLQLWVSHILICQQKFIY